MVFTLPCFLSTLLTLVMPHFLPDQFVKRNKTIFVIYIIMILLYFGWFFNELWKFWTFGEILTLLGFINRYILGKGSQAVATLIGFFSFYLLMVFHITSAHFYCILSKNYNHSKCVQNIVFYAGWQLNGNDLCKKPCQIITFQVSKSDINAEMQEMDYMGWVEFTLYIETIVISYPIFLHTLPDYRPKILYSKKVYLCLF